VFVQEHVIGHGDLEFGKSSTRLTIRKDIKERSKGGVLRLEGSHFRRTYGSKGAKERHRWGNDKGLRVDILEKGNMGRKDLTIKLIGLKISKGIAKDRGVKGAIGGMGHREGSTRRRINIGMRGTFLVVHHEVIALQAQRVAQESHVTHLKGAQPL